MSKARFLECLNETLRYEGGLTNDKHDPGGLTNYGITQKVYDSYNTQLNRPKKFVSLITEEEFIEIYKLNYWDMVLADRLRTGIDFCVFDCAVNSGVYRSIVFLQRALNLQNCKLQEDGIIGEKTIEIHRRVKQDKLINDFCDLRMKFLKGLTTFKYFGKGWTNRVKDCKKVAMKGYKDELVKRA